MRPNLRSKIAPIAASLVTLSLACATGDGREVDGNPTTDGPHNEPDPLIDASVLAEQDANYTKNDFYQNDPPPKWCGPDGGGSAPPAPGGTPACPSDKNLEGCPCDHEGESAPCWPGYRKNRGLGICADGKTTCIARSEGLDKVWGKCDGAVLPVQGVTSGKEACGCFSEGEWKISNLAPCSVTQGTTTYAVSTNSSTGQCPSSSLFPPKAPSGYWSKNTLKVDCAGHFRLCYTLKAGNVAQPKGSDCVVASVCTEADYTKAGTVQELPVLPSWASSDASCSHSFNEDGGYGELTVKGQSVLCDDVSDKGNPYVFARIGYCPKICATNPSATECKGCTNGGGGTF